MSITNLRGISDRIKYSGGKWNSIIELKLSTFHCENCLMNYRLFNSSTITVKCKVSIAIRWLFTSFAFSMVYVFTYFYEIDCCRMDLSNSSPLQMKNSKKILARTRACAHFLWKIVIYLKMNAKNLAKSYILWMCIKWNIYCSKNRFKSLDLKGNLSTRIPVNSENGQT